MRTAKEIIAERYWYHDCNNRREINLDDLAEIIIQIRAEALEEAAKEAAKHFIYGHSVAGPHFVAEIAKAIRAIENK